MLLLFHIVVAFASMGFTFYAYISPSPSKLRVAFVLAGMTFASGAWLLAQHPSHLVPACIAGLLYFSIVSIGIAAARHKLLAAERVS